MTAADRPIIARDIDGEEHELVVMVRLGLITISDDEIERIMTIDAGLDLAWRLLECAIRWRQSEAGPLSSTF